jgi:hypothetical protein
MATSTHKHYLYAAFFVLTLALIFSVAEGRLNKQRQATFQIHRNYNTIVYNRIKSADSRLMERNDSRNNDHASTKTDSANRWLAGNFQNDYELLKNAITKQSAMDKLQQQQRQYTLDYGFARNRRPLVHDSLKAFAIIGSWTVFFVSGCACESISHLLNVWEHISWLKRIHLAATYLFINLTYIHHWIVGMIFPLFFLIWARSGQCTSARVLEEFFKTKGSPLSEAPKFFYTSDLAKKKSKYKDTGDYVLCLVENWSSAVIPTFAMGLFLCLSRLSKKEKVTAFINAGYPQQLFSPLLLILPALCRVVTRLGAAASLHQYPSLLFELRRNDQPRPVCRSNAYMQRGVSMFLKWIPVAVASDLAVMIILIRQRRNDIGYGVVGPNIAAASLLSIVAPITHLISLMRIIRITRCSAVSLSEATSFQDLGHDAVLQRKATDEERKVKWRYQLRWRTPKRISETLRSWMNYFLTGHAPLLSMNDWKDHPLRIGEFATEGAYSLFSDRGKTDNSESRQDGDDLTPSADSITESLSLIFRDRDAAIHNATRARYTKHQEAYDTKALYDVLGVAVQQTFDIGLSYDFDHFNPPDSKNVSIHQLRARMAKSAVRQKRELDRQMKEELEVLYRLKKNVVTPKNEDVAEDEMKTIQNEIRHRGFDEIESMKTALLTLIPTSALAPEGTEKYESPIMVAEYVNLTAPVENREFKATVESTPDALSIIEEYVRKDFGEEAADAYRQEEIAHRLKERRMLERFRKKYGELKDEADERSQFT